MYANQYGYSDITPYEVVKQVSEKTLDIREMDSERDDSVKLEFQAGGFMAHCANQRDQKWLITANAANPVVRIRLNRAGVWLDRDGRRFKLDVEPIRFYDYNF